MKQILRNGQIPSAIIWAITIIVCGFLTSNSAITTVLITAAGIHVVMMTQLKTNKQKNCVK